MSHRLLRGRLLRPLPRERRFELLPDALLALDAQGRVASVGPAPPGHPLPETHPGCVLLPAFVDTHVHYPQTRISGSASGPLLDWLARSVFPEEARFAERAYAEAVAAEFCDALLDAGTTAAAVFGPPQPEAAEVLMEALAARGLAGWAGLTLMDRGAPPANLLAAGPALEATEALARRWHGGRLSVCVTPRFALSCTPGLLSGAAALAARLDLPVQTHINENLAEIEQTALAFPGARDYLDVYDGHGLLGPRTLLAHCVHQGPEVWARMARAGARVAHCPDSNFFLGSGCMRLAEALDHGLALGLGSDVGAGRTFKLPQVAARAYDASLLVGAPVEPEALLWLATLGGARALSLDHRLGALAPGQDADLVAIAAPEGLEGPALFDALLFRPDGPGVTCTYVMGRPRARTPR